MSRVYGEPVEVWTRDGVPARFVWRERLFTVTRVLEQWATGGAYRGQGEATQREFWRLQARAGAEAPAAVYELRREVATDDWLLARVWE